MKRINSIDILRGLVMIIMTLDHTRDLIHVTSLSQQPTDLATTTPVLFFTRWITHLCAPTFVFLSGASAYISYKSKNNVSETRRFLISRGLWLIILDLTLINFGVWFDVHFAVILFDVLSAIGFGFIILSLLLKAPIRTILIIGIAIIFLHNLTPLVPFPEASLFKKIFMPFFAPGAFPIGNNTMFVMGYPPIPWLGIILVGFASGKLLFELPELKRKNIFLKIGLISLALFIVIRFINIYGDSFSWTNQKNGLYTFLSFINATKYPPSLAFCLMMLGCMFLILSAVEASKNRFTDIATVYGKVPLFYFLMHWYIIHPLMFLIVFLQGYKTIDLTFGFNFGRPKNGGGVELWVIYLLWIGVLAAMYPVCKWYRKYKENHREKKWLRYL